MKSLTAERQPLSIASSQAIEQTLPLPDQGAPAASCPLGLALNVIGGRWKLHVLRSLFLAGPQRYNELLRGIDGISPKELTRNLRELEGAGLLLKVDDRDGRYALTALGKELLPAFKALGAFGQRIADARQATRSGPQSPP